MFYCDPPFTGSDNTRDYEFVMDEEKHLLLHDLLSKISGKFILSYDDSPKVRKLYKGFTIEKTKPVFYTLNQKKRYQNELLIRNF